MVLNALLVILEVLWFDQKPAFCMVSLNTSKLIEPRKVVTQVPLGNRGSFLWFSTFSYTEVNSGLQLPKRPELRCLGQYYAS